MSIVFYEDKVRRSDGGYDTYHAQTSAEQVLGLSKLKIYFTASLKGLPFTVSREGFLYEATVPDSLVAYVPGVELEAAYSISCGAMNRTITTSNFYGITPVAFGVLRHSWRDIIQIAESGAAQDHFSIGDEISIALTGGETLNTQIYGFNCDKIPEIGVSPSEYKTAGITFGLKTLHNLREMNTANTNVGGFPGSEMFAWLQNTIYNQFPNEIKPHLKTKDLSPEDDASAKIFLFSAAECGSYPIFATAADRIRRSPTNMPTRWWLRSTTLNYPTPGPANTFCYVDESGVIQDGGSPSAMYGVNFGFCI